MKLVIVHNLYQQAGGEDVVAERETKLLQDKGHEVIRYTRSNNELNNLSFTGKVFAQSRAIWSARTYKDITSIIRDVRPDIVHFHNTHLVISPSAYYACRRMGVPVVQSLHNPRMMCPSANLYREGKVCQECVGKAFAWPGIVHACYRHSRIETSGVAAVVSAHRLLGTWNRYVDRYIVFTDFYRRKFIDIGLPPAKVAVKPHFVAPDPQERTGAPGDYALYIGRLDPEKGAQTLLEAWKQVRGFSLVVRGDGQGLPAYQEAIQAGTVKNVRVVGRLSAPDLTALIKGARVLVWPSEGMYETFGLVAIEAFACGIPVISGNIGVAGELVRDGATGITFEAGNVEDLARKLQWAADHPLETAQMGHTARGVYEERYTAEANYERLLQIYREAIEESGSYRREQAS